MGKSIFLLILITLITACSGGGSGGENSSEGKASLIINIPTYFIVQTSSLPYRLPFNVLCEASNLFKPYCEIGYARITIANDYSYDIPLNLSIKHKENVNIENRLTVFTHTDLETPHFVFLTADNPSLSYSGAKQYMEILGGSKTEVIATAEEECGNRCTCEGGGSYNSNNNRCELTKPTGLPCPTGYTDISGLCVSSATCSQACEVKKYYEYNIPDYTQGTLLITDGIQTLRETSFGRLTGNGNGVVEAKAGGGYKVKFSFAGSPLKNSMIIIQYLEVLRGLVRSPVFSLYVFYGNLIMELKDGYLVDNSGKIYGILNIATNKLEFTTPIGAAEGVFIVKYSSDLFNLGGTVVGRGDGVNKIYTLRLSPFLLKEGLKVFTSNQNAEIVIIRETVGEIVAMFSDVVHQGQEIKAQYRVTKVFKPIKIDIYGKNNELLFSQTSEMEVR